MGESDKRKVGQNGELLTAAVMKSSDSDAFHFRFTPPNEQYNKVVCRYSPLTRILLLKHFPFIRYPFQK